MLLFQYKICGAWKNSSHRAYSRVVSKDFTHVLLSVHHFTTFSHTNTLINFYLCMYIFVYLHHYTIYAYAKYMHHKPYIKLEIKMIMPYMK